MELETSDLSEAGAKRTFDQCIEKTTLADQLGYRSVWFTEHHFLPGFSYSSSQELGLAGTSTSGRQDQKYPPRTLETWAIARRGTRHTRRYILNSDA